MPELPEVETIRRQLSPKLPCKILQFDKSPVANSILKTEKFSLKNSFLLSIERKGKMLIFHFDQGVMISHLGMSGTWIWSEKENCEKHAHLKLCLDSGFLTYVDPRRFGNCYLVNTENDLQKHLDKLGVDISGEDFNFEYLKKIQKQFPQKILKPFLLDQKYFAGMGNYLASEVCAVAKIKPTRKVKNLSMTDLKNLIIATQTVLTRAIAGSGVTFAGGYRDSTGAKGEAVGSLVVFYQKICGLCKKGKIKKVILGGRGTYYCGLCQK
jgi:formamidopyrimidine-DNA glycosylase